MNQPNHTLWNISQEIIELENLINRLQDYEDLSEEELADRLFDQFGKSTLGGEQKETTGIPVPQRFKDNINALHLKFVSMC